VLNLLDNALKHAPAGSTVRVRQQRTANALHLTVADEGPGIPPAERERVFERFVHGVQRARDAETTGAGLGLAIARAIAQAHGGRIGLLDAPRGATFEVVLPLLSPAGDHP
jgi:signal transduction histidine kinase